MRSAGYLLALAALILLAGCAAKAVRVRCDVHLQPINPPAVSQEQAPHAGTAKLTRGAP